MSSFLREIGLKKGSQAETFPFSYRGIENFILLDFDNTFVSTEMTDVCGILLSLLISMQTLMTKQTLISVHFFKIYGLLTHS